jgi:drug/metabolite transporter (DMT)-like permease
MKNHHPIWQSGTKTSLLLSEGEKSSQQYQSRVGEESQESMFTLYVFIVLSLLFVTAFGVIARKSLATTTNEHAYTILWQLSSGFLALLFLPFDTFSMHVTPSVLLNFGLSICFYALADAFLFSGYKYEEASVLSALLPVSYVFTFLVTVLFFQTHLTLSIVGGIVLIIAASLLVGFSPMQFKPSKGVVFGLLTAFFSGVALGFNSEVVKSFSVALYLFAAFVFPALVNFFVFLRPKVTELTYELHVQWKVIVLNAAVIALGYFFLLKAFQLGNLTQIISISATSTLLTALAGIVLLKEREYRPKNGCICTCDSWSYPC